MSVTDGAALLGVRDGVWVGLNNAPGSGVAVWTGLTESYTLAEQTCDNWSSSISTLTGRFGAANRTDEVFIAGPSEYCESELHLYCVEQPAFQHRIFATNREFGAAFAEQANEWLGKSFSAEEWRGAADALCQGSADAAVLGGTFVALIEGGDGTGDGDLFYGITDEDGPWALVDGTPVADTVEELIEGVLSVPIDMTETRARFNTGGEYVWTGEHFSATYDYDCSDWTSATSGVRGRYGDARAANDSWDSSGQMNCDNRNHLYCLEVGTGGARNNWPDPPSSDRALAFVTGDITRGNIYATAGEMGLTYSENAHEAGDYICQKVAEDGDLAGTFRVYLSTTENVASDRFEDLGMSGPWYRTDGTLIARDIHDLRGYINVPINYLADGTRADNNHRYAFTGQSPADTLNDNCEDWTTTDGPGYRGGVYKRSSGWQYGIGGSSGCGSLESLYCFEQQSGAY